MTDQARIEKIRNLRKSSHLCAETIDFLLAQLDAALKREALWREYVALLRGEVKKTFGIAAMHGIYGCTPEQATRAEELRAQLGIK